MITFSVVTITYNAAPVLQATLDSVLMQDYPHVEHLIIDGASTDETVQIAESYRQQSAETDNEHVVRIQSEPDNGLYDAMNKGLRLATGDYVVFLNAGDRFPAADTLDRVVLAAVVGDGEEHPAVLFGDTDIIDEKGNFLCHRRLSPPERLTWRSFRYGMLVCHQAFYARTDIARSLPYDTGYRYSADVDWCIRVMKEGEQRGLLLRNIHAVVADYVQEGQTTLHHKESLRERFDVMRRHYGLLQTLFLHAWFALRSLVR
ncbi:glycosyltransferase family 2 protein [Prevotella multiformis]|uniref:glycosyltransferase family 2 protein n=1 Tax=Prevotella multiformis TaxID=282402 RepID=UPI0023F3EE95|nr:glycosyltransferase family 2 protein [Prevotella multiformis]